MTTPKENPRDEGLRDIVELFRKQCINKHGGIGFEETVYRLKAREECLVREAKKEATDKVFIDIPTCHELTRIAKVHEDACSQSQGFMCDCSVLKAVQYAVDKAKERLAALTKQENQNE